MKQFSRYLYAPWQWLILVPVMVVSTLFCGTGAVVLALLVNARVGSMCGTLWARINAFFTPMRVRVVGRHNIDPRQSYILVSNHRSHYDVFVLYGWLGIDFKWVMKQELRKVPMIGFACHRLGHVFVDRSDRAAAVRSLRSAKEKIVDGTSVLFFAEGTRSRSGNLAPFKKGAFKMAIDLDLPILPITINGTREILAPKTKSILPGQAEMIIHEPISSAGFDDSNLGDFITEVRERIESALPTDSTQRIGQ